MSEQVQPWDLENIRRFVRDYWGEADAVEMDQALAQHDAEILREAAHSGLFGANAQSTLLELARQKEEENGRPD